MADSLAPSGSDSDSPSQAPSPPSLRTLTADAQPPLCAFNEDSRRASGDFSTQDFVQETESGGNDVDHAQ
jgi:hypothetical protein